MPYRNRYGTFSIPDSQNLANPKKITEAFSSVLTFLSFGYIMRMKSDDYFERANLSSRDQLDERFFVYTSVQPHTDVQIGYERIRRQGKVCPNVWRAPFLSSLCKNSIDSKLGTVSSFAVLCRRWGCVFFFIIIKAGKQARTPCSPAYNKDLIGLHFLPGYGLVRYYFGLQPVFGLIRPFSLLSSY